MVDYTVLPPYFRVVDKLIDGQAYGEPHKISLRPMDKGLCFDGCGFSHEEDITKRHLDAEYIPKDECLFFDSDCPHKTKFCPHGCGTIVFKAIGPQNSFHDCIGEETRGFPMTRDFLKENGLHDGNIDDFTKNKYEMSQSVGLGAKEAKPWVDHVRSMWYRDEVTLERNRLALYQQAQAQKMTRAKRIHDLEVQRQTYSTKHPNLVKKIVQCEKKVENSRAKPLSDYV